jgi:hypothetical protein
MKDRRIKKKYKMDQRKNRARKKNPAGGMDVCVVFVVRTVVWNDMKDERI